MYAEAVFDDLVACPICLEKFTRPKTLPCEHVLCYSCIHGLCRGQPTFQCPVCRVTHHLPAEGVAAFPDNLFIKSLLSRPRKSRPCDDCQGSDGVTVCQHCHTKVCVDCRVDHTANTAVIGEYQKQLKCSVSSKPALARTRQKVNHWREFIQDLKKDANEVTGAFDEAFKELSIRKTKVQKAVDTLLKIEEGLYAVANENADPSEIYKHLTDQVPNCTTTQSLIDLKHQLSMAKTAVQLLLSSDDQFRVVWDKDFLEAVRRFGRIEFGGELFNIEEEGDESHSGSKEEKVEIEDQAVSPLEDAEADAGVESSTSTVIVEAPVDRAASGDEDRNRAVPQHESINTQVSEESAAGVRETPGGVNPVEDECGATCSSLSTDESSAATSRQDQLPRNVHYQNKNTSSTTIIGRSGDDRLKLKYPWSAVYSVYDNMFYVADSGNGRVMVYSIDGANGRVLYQVRGPVDVAVSDAHIIVLCSTQIHLVTRDGVWTKTITSSQHRPLSDCRSVLYHNNHIIVLDADNKSVIFHDRDGVYKRHFTTDKILTNPWSLAVDNRGMIYITDWGEKGDVKVFDWDGHYQEQFGGVDNRYDVCGVCVDGEGYVSVTRYNSHRVDVYGPDRRFVCSYGRPGSGPGCLQRPMTIRLMPDGRAIVCDYCNHRVQLF